MSDELASRWATGTSLGEAAAVALLLAGLVTLAARPAATNVRRVAVLEALSLSTSAKIDWMEYWATTGLWPTRVASADASAPTLTAPHGIAPFSGDPSFLEPQRIEAGDGSVAFVFRGRRKSSFFATLYRGDDVLKGYAVGVRPAFGPGESPTAVVWLCGLAAPPPGFVAPATNLTTMPAKLLPSPCQAPLDPADR